MENPPQITPEALERQRIEDALHTEKWEEGLMCKCDRCGRIRPFFQAAPGNEPDRFIQRLRDNGANAIPKYTNAIPKYTSERVNVAHKHGYCEECAVELNKKMHDDSLLSQAREEERNRVVKTERGVIVKWLARNRWGKSKEAQELIEELRRGIHAGKHYIDFQPKARSLKQPRGEEGK